MARGVGSHCAVASEGRVTTGRITANPPDKRKQYDHGGNERRAIGLDDTQFVALAKHRNRRLPTGYKSHRHAER